MIEIKDLTVAFNETTIFENINLKLFADEMTVIVGASGSGKSVLMKTVLGLIKPVGGTVIIDGEDIFAIKRRQLNNVRKKMAMLFQGGALLDSMNVFQNVALPMVEHLNLSDEELARNVKEKLHLVGLENIEHKLPSELSGGMKKRVSLARAISLNPYYIIYDEPTTGLDPIIASGITNLIQKIKSQTTSIVITHDLECISKLKSRIVMLDNKKIIFDGSYKDFKKSKIEKIRRFVGNENF